jgi:hypothetical protein
MATLILPPRSTVKSDKGQINHRGRVRKTSTPMPQPDELRIAPASPQTDFIGKIDALAGFICPQILQGPATGAAWQLSGATSMGLFLAVAAGSMPHSAAVDDGAWCHIRLRRKDPE